MAGIIADLTWQGIKVPQGYVEIHHVVGGPNYCCTQSAPGGQWLGYLYYYANQDARKADINSNIPIDDYALTQVLIPYVAGEDPYAEVLKVLQEWFPAGKIVP